ncbi:MAG: hypothetical protein V4663_16450 [Bacteroidota bacterium]
MATESAILALEGFLVSAHHRRLALSLFLITKKQKIKAENAMEWIISQLFASHRLSRFAEKASLLHPV